jgi:transposase
LAHLAGVVIERVDRHDGRLVITARARAVQAMCHHCGKSSGRVHSHYRRRLADVAVAGTPVLLQLRVRRFFCDHDGCPAVTFVEQVTDLTARHARRTSVLTAMLTAIGLALAGRAGARLALRVRSAIADGPSAACRAIRGADGLGWLARR